MDQAIQKAVREAVKDFDHTSDYYFLIFNNLTKTFDSTTSTSQQQPQSPQPSSDGAEETPDSSDKEYLDYLLFDSGDGVIVRIERRSPSPSTLKIKNCNQITDNTHKIFNYDLNLKISSSSSNWEDDISDFDSTKNCLTSSLVASSATTSITTTTATVTGTSTTASTTGTVKKIKKSTSLLTDNISNNLYNHNEPMKQLQNSNTFYNSSSDSLAMQMIDDGKSITHNHNRVQQNNIIGGISGNNDSNSGNRISVNGYHGTDSDDDNILFDSSSEKPWICKDCNRGYKWRNSLTCHQKNECGKPPKYYCTKLCGYRTNIRSNLRRHLNTKCSSKDRITTPRETYTIQYTTKNLDGNNGNGMNRLNKTLS